MKTIKVVAYYRCSDVRQDRSISQQREEVEKWADGSRRKPAYV